MESEMYILIMEDGSIYKTDTITKDEYQSVADGYCSIINSVDLTELDRNDQKPIIIISV